MIPARGPQTNTNDTRRRREILVLGTQAATGKPGLQAIRSWAWVPLGTQAATGKPGLQAIRSWAWVPLGTLGYPGGDQTGVGGSVEENPEMQR